MKKFSLNFPGPRGFLPTAALIYLVLLATQWQIGHILGRSVDTTDFNFPAIYRLIIAAALVIYAVVRFWRFHPAVNLRYATWLMSSPWRVGRPLPLGPLHLVWQDFLVFIPAFLIERFQLQLTGLEPLIVFLIIYNLSATAAVFITKFNAWILIMLAGIPGTLLLFDNPWCNLLLLVCLYPISLLATRKSLQYFPWKILQPKPQPESANWLFTRLGPVELTSKIPQLAAFLLSAFAAWWIFCITSAIADYQEATGERNFLEFFRTLVMLLGLATALIRLGIYAITMWPPISLLGRIVTGRLIIPGYDKILLVPILTVLTALLCPFIFRLGVSAPAGGAISVFLILYPALAFGPSLYRWRLTGFHRISTIPPSTNTRRSTKGSTALDIKFS